MAPSLTQPPLQHDRPHIHPAIAPINIQVLDHNGGIVETYDVDSLLGSSYVHHNHALLIEPSDPLTETPCSFSANYGQVYDY